MKRSLNAILITLAVTVIMLITACNPPIIVKTAGPVITRNYDVEGFTAIEAGHAFEANIAPSDTYSVAITTNEQAFEYITVRTRGKTLEITTTGLYRPFHDVNVLIEIAMPDLDGVSLSGAAMSRVSGFTSAHDFEIDLSGGSDLDIEIETGNADIELSGASNLSGSLTSTATAMTLSGSSNVRLSGSGDALDIEGSGASTFDLEDYAVNSAYLTLSGASKATLLVNGTLDAELSGASQVQHRGDTEPGDIDLSGGSSCRQKQ